MSLLHFIPLFFVIVSSVVKRKGCFNLESIFRINVSNVFATEHFVLEDILVIIINLSHRHGPDTVHVQPLSLYISTAKEISE